MIIEDNLLFMDGLKRILELELGYRVAAYSSEQINDIAERKDHSNLLRERPQLIIMDSQLRIGSSLSLVELFKKKLPECKLLVLSSVEKDGEFRRFFQAGVDGYLFKDIMTEELINGINAIFNQKSFFHHKVAHYLIQDYRQLLDQSPQVVKPIAGNRHNLSKREFEVLELLVKGKSNKSISEQLFLSEKTVKNHVSKILLKLKVGDRTNAVLFAIKEKMVSI
nr:response regulator transcription factor [Fictibacillus marinisediminis]